MKDLIFEGDKMIYEKKRMIAVIALVPIILTLMLSINFKAWSGYYVEGDLESIVVHQMEKLENGYKEENSSIELTDANRMIAEEVLFAYTGMFMLACLLLFLIVNRILLYQKPVDTLCSLSVRMNN